MLKRFIQIKKIFDKIIIRQRHIITNKRATLKLTKNNDTKMQRQWIKLKNSNNSNGKEECTQSNQKNNNEQYKLMSYNILAQDLLTEHINLYTGTDWQYLYWKERLKRLRDEICQLKPDILCVQEMQYDHINELLQNIRQQRKLEYVYKKKTNNRTDGCAIIYDSEKFCLMAEQPLEYFSVENRKLNRGNVAIMAKFSSRAEPEKEFVVATTHLLFNPKREDIRYEQARLLLDALQTFAITDATAKNYVPIILTGDFNSQAHAAAYQALIEPKECLQMLPVYFGDNAVSTLQDYWVLVDHILYTQTAKCLKHNICISSVLKLPTSDVCSNMLRTPNNDIGSDHFSLALTFSIV